MANHTLNHIVCCRLLPFYSGTHCFFGHACCCSCFCSYCCSCCCCWCICCCLNKTKLVYPFLLSNISGYSRVFAAMAIAKDASWQWLAVSLASSTPPLPTSLTASAAGLTLSQWQFFMLLSVFARVGPLRVSQLVSFFFGCFVFCWGFNFLNFFFVFCATLKANAHYVYAA